MGEVISSMYDFAWNYRAGQVAVLVNGCIGFINEIGKWEISPIFQVPEKVRSLAVFLK